MTAAASTGRASWGKSLLITLWRTMRAHETLAAAIKKIAERQEPP